MLRQLSLFLLLPVGLLIIAIYVTIPMWAGWLIPNLTLFQSDNFNQWHIERVKVKYPSLSQWSISQVIAKHTQDNTQLVLDNVTFHYQWPALMQGTLANVTIAKADIVLGATANNNTRASLFNHKQTKDLALMLLYPASWLANAPNVSITRFDIGTNLMGNPPPSLSGKLSINAQKAHVIARFNPKQTTNDAVFIEGRLAANNDIELTLLTEATSSAIAKLTSQSHRTGTALLWQGKLAANIGLLSSYTEAFLPDRWSRFLPLNSAQGKLTNHWRVSLPLSAFSTNEDMDFRDLLNNAKGVHELEIEAQAQPLWANTLSVNTNITHTLNAEAPDTWQVNVGSQLFTHLNWQHLNLSPATIANMGLANMELRLNAQSPVTIYTDDIGNEMRLDGMINATMGTNTTGHPMYAQLMNLRYGPTGTWRGDASISGNYALPVDSALLQQLPIGIEQVNALADVQFHLLPERWQFSIAKHSKLMAHQVFSQEKQGKMQLFANDRLNLFNHSPITFTYHIPQDQWQWSDVHISLQPETITSTDFASSKTLGLSLNLPAGMSKLSQRINQGSFTLNAKDTQVAHWPRFDLVGSGIFVLAKNTLELVFSGNALPLSPEVDIGIDWQWQDNASSDNQRNIGTAEINAQHIPLPLLQSNGSHAWPVVIEQGKGHYTGQWKWLTQHDRTQVTGRHHITVDKLSIDNPSYYLTDAKGHITMLQTTNSQPTVDTGTSNNTKTPTKNALSATYQLHIPTLVVKQVLPNHPIVAVDIHATANNTKNLGLADILQSPEQWQLDHFTGSVLGGDITLDNPSTIPNQSAQASHHWQINKLNLNLLSKALYPPLRAQGSVSGMVQTNNQWQIQGFQLSTDDAALLHLVAPIPDDMPSAATLNVLLKDFNSQQLTLLSTGADPMTEANNSHTNTHPLPIDIQLEGASATYKHGQTVHFNVKLDADINQRLQQSQP